MRIFTEIASHDTTGVAPGGRIIRTDSSPEDGETTAVNGQWIFEVPEGASLDLDPSSYWFPVDAGSIPARAAAELLIRYPMYDHIVYNFYLDNDDADSFDTSSFGTLPSSSNTTPAYSGSLVPPIAARCQLGRGSGPGDVGMVPNSLALLPRSEARASNVYGCVLTSIIDLWGFNPCYVEVNDPITLIDGDTVALAGITLTARVGAPTTDEFQIGGTASVTATNIVNAINSGTNSFSGFVSAIIDPTVSNRVQLRPVPPGNTSVTVAAGVGVTGFTVVESHPGTDEVLMWWKVSTENVSEDQGYAAQGPGSGQNSPSIKSITEIPGDVSALLVYVSVDDGVTWTQVPYMEPVNLAGTGTDMRVCFVNIGGTKIHLQGFCVLFSDLLSPL